MAGLLGGISAGYGAGAGALAGGVLSSAVGDGVNVAAGYEVSMGQAIASGLVGGFVRSGIQNLLGNGYVELVRHNVTFPLYAEVEICNFGYSTSPIHYQFDPVAAGMRTCF